MPNVPQGYEDAAVADEARPAVEAQIEEDAGSLIDVLVGALAEDADPNIRKLEQQFLPQFQPLLKPDSVVHSKKYCTPPLGSVASAAVISAQ